MHVPRLNKREDLIALPIRSIFNNSLESNKKVISGRILIQKKRIKKINIRDLLILGRAAPDRIRKGLDVSCCVGGYSNQRGFIRIYPTTIESKLNIWNNVKIPLERDTRDWRRESWKIRGSQTDYGKLDKKIKVLRKFPPKKRRQLIWHLRDGCVKEINDNKRSLGIIHPVEISCSFKKRKDVLQKKVTLHNFLDFPLPKHHWVKTKKEYDYVPVVKYKCSKCQAKQKFHQQQLISIEAYEWMRKHPDNLDQLWENYHINDPDYDFYLFVGNQFLYPTSFIVISILRFKKSRYPLKRIKPLIPFKKC